jgi:hypothetical protein
MKTKCPFCDYYYGFNHDTQKDEEPEEGEFYTLPIIMERFDVKLERVEIYAYPRCKKLFTS